MPVTAPSDRRFRRAHLKPARKRAGFAGRRWRAALAICVVALAVYAAQRALAVATGLKIFHIDQINVHGNHWLSKGEALAMLHDLRGRSVLAVDLNDWRQTLLNSPWVADASLRRTLPSTVDVVILERAPLGIGRINGSLYLVDDRGDVIDDYGPNYADVDLPLIDGFSPSPTPPGEQSANIYRAQLARRLLDALRAANMASQISQMDVRDSRNAVVMLEGDTTLIRLGGERFVERLQSYHELASALRERVPAIDYVDLRFDERVYVRPARERPSQLGGAKRVPAKSGRPTQTG